MSELNLDNIKKQSSWDRRLQEPKIDAGTENEWCLVIFAVFVEPIFDQMWAKSQLRSVGIKDSSELVFVFVWLSKGLVEKNDCFMIGIWWFVA